MMNLPVMTVPAYLGLGNVIFTYVTVQIVKMKLIVNLKTVLIHNLIA